MYQNGQDLINYYSNHYLASDDAQAFLKSAFGSNKDFFDSISKRIANHNKAMEQLNKKIAASVPSPQQIQVPTNGQTQVPNGPSSQLGSMLSGK